MWNTFLKHIYTSKSKLIDKRRWISHSLNTNLGVQMKCLNEKNQYEQVLRLFDEYRKNQSNRLDSTIITQTLKACTQLNDFHRGKFIHHLITSNLFDDSYISASLIHMYSKLIDDEFLFCM